MRSRFASLTSRLVLTTVALVVAVSLVIGVATSLAVRSYLMGQLDDRVTSSLGRALRFDGFDPGIVGDFSQSPMGAQDGDRVGPPGQSVGTLTGIWTAGDASFGFVITDGDTDQRELSSAALAILDAVPADGRVRDVELPAFGHYRVAVSPQSDGGKVAAGLPTGDVDDVVSTLIGWEVLLVVLGGVLAAGAGLLLVRRQLRPLREVAATAHAVAELPLESGEIELAQRVPTHLTDERTEVGQVGAALNTLLNHVETSLEARQRSELQVRQFVADASHELRTPLSTIAGYTELARRRPGDPEMARMALDKVEEESGRMTSLVEDLLLLARLDAGRPLDVRPVDLTRLLLDAVSDARVLAPQHRWQLELPEPVEVLGDEQRLHQVVTNLLTNARKYTPAGTTVTITTTDTPTGTGFAVHDDGPGFPVDLVDHAFERFARGDASRNREGGAGLGLALVDAIVTAHHGRVSLDSEPGSTTIDVQLTPVGQERSDSLQ